MARSRRVQVPGGFHHITMRGNDRQAIFIDDADRRTFLSVLGESVSRHQFSVHAFCLMTNHVHIALEDHRGELSNILRRINGTYAQRFNRQHGRTGHVFERRFWSSLIERDTYLTTVVEYIHRNPLEARMTNDLADYRWSSYPSYVEHRTPPRFLTRSTVMGYYGNDVGLVRRSTESGDRSPTTVDFGSRNRPAIIGSERFEREAARTALPDRPADTARWPLSRIEDVVALTFAVDVESLRTTVRGQRNRPRSCAIHLAHVHAGWPLQDVADHFDLRTSSAVSMTSSRFARLIGEEPATARLAEEAQRRLGQPAQTPPALSK